VVVMILEGVLKEGDALPSVRSVAVEFHLNPLTVLKGYQQLVEETARGEAPRPGDVRQRRRAQGADEGERQRFLEEEWPKVYATIHALDSRVRAAPWQCSRTGDTVAPDRRTR